MADSADNDRIQHIHLKLNITNLVTADHIEVTLNGVVLSPDTCRHTIRP